MKKLIILAAVVVASVVANAASVKWTAANIYSSDPTVKFSGDVLLYAYEYGTDAKTATLVSTFTTTTAGSVSQTFTSGDLDGTKNYNFYFVIEDGGKSFTSVVKENVAMYATQTQTVAFGNQGPATQAAGNWAAVPEPTSGLLLLLGMAGLALKRKHA